MGAIVRVENVTFSYAHRSEKVLKNVSFQVQKGEFILLTGVSGCGKSTVLKLLNGLIPQESGGEFYGNVYINGQNTRTVAVADISSLVGMVFQSPEDQIFASTVFDEVAFVLENMGFRQEEIEVRVNESLTSVGLAGKENSSIHTLSGGQKQRLAVAAVLAAKPQVLALDEPISQVDPANAEKLLQLLTDLNKEENIAVLLVEHRLHEALNVCGRVMVMDAGQIVWDGPVREALARPEIFSGYGLRLPQVVDICCRLKVDLTDDVAKAAEIIRTQLPLLPPTSMPTPMPEPTSMLSLMPTSNADSKTAVHATRCALQRTPEVCKVENLSFSYDGKINTLRNISLSVRRGEITALMGTNGAGKSTLIQHIAGILTPDAGEIVFQAISQEGRIGFIMQNPDFMLFNRTVKDEILFGLRQMRQNTAAEHLIYEKLATQLALEKVAGDFPLSLSRGQRLRVAIASVLSFTPQLMLLDEPTTGQDISRIGDILTTLKQYRLDGGTVIFCTHDTEIAASFAERILLMQEGEIIADTVPAVAFNDEVLLKRAGLKQPPAMKLAAMMDLKGALSVEEVVRAIESAAIGNHAGQFFSTAH